MWNPKIHSEFGKGVRQGIKEVMMLVRGGYLPSQAVPMDVLFVIFQYLAEESSGGNSKRRRIGL